MLRPRQTLDARMAPVMTPRMQQAVRLLQLSSQDYEMEMLALAQRNPFLVVETDGGADDQRMRLPAADGSALLQPMPPPDEYTIASDAYADRQSTATTSVGPITIDDTAAAAADQPSLQQHLWTQADLLPLPARDKALVHAVIDALEDDGYLRTPLSDTAQWLGLQPEPTPSELRTALRLVQSFDPVGVGAVDLRECLLLQLRGSRAGLAALASTIVADHLPAMARGDFDAIARSAAQPVLAVKQACALIRRLDPHPGWRHQTTRTEYVRADVIVHRAASMWEARLNVSAMPRMRLDNTCAALFQQHRQPHHTALDAALQEARWAMRNAQQRVATILAVAQLVTRRQQNYFEHGPLALRPMALSDIADELGVHESTVSRVTNNKFMDTPVGLIELKRFFSRPMPLDSGGSCTPMAIRSLVMEIIRAESPSDPLSDVEITHCLTRQGVRVARRTVTKYRQMLKLPPVELRRHRCTTPVQAAPSPRHGIAV